MKDWSEEYKKYLKSNHWKNLRTKAISKYGKYCDICNKSHKNIDVHHLEYPENLENVTVDMLRVLCGPCHRNLHVIKDTSNLKSYEALKIKVRSIVDGKNFNPEILKIIDERESQKKYQKQTYQYKKPNKKGSKLPKKEWKRTKKVAQTNEILKNENIDEKEFNDVFWNLNGTHTDIAKYFKIPRKQVGVIRKRLESKGILKKHLAIIEKDLDKLLKINNSQNSS